jgi:hypothetical protein
MNDVLLWASALIGVAFAVIATISAVRKLARGESVWKTIKTWFTRLIDSISGVG